jgi:hypothetical protein
VYAGMLFGPCSVEHTSMLLEHMGMLFGASLGVISDAVWSILVCCYAVWTMLFRAYVYAGMLFGPCSADHTSILFEHMGMLPEHMGMLPEHMGMLPEHMWFWLI